MGGFTTVYLKDTSDIQKHNKLLADYGVRKSIRFWSQDNLREEFKFWMQCQSKGRKEQLKYYPEWIVNKYGFLVITFDDFIKYIFSPDVMGETFVPKVGSLGFDCYFGRTSKRAMRNLGRYIVDNYRDIKKVRGSFETFMERGMTPLERQIIVDSHLKTYLYDVNMKVPMSQA